MANKQLQLRRGTATATDSFAGAEGEVTYVTDTKTLRVFDGSTTTGGTELLKADMSNVSADGTTIIIDAQVQLSSSTYATTGNSNSLTLATKGWVESQGSGGGLVGALNNIGDTTITSPTLGDFLIYQGSDAASGAKWANYKISGDVNVDEEGQSTIQDGAVTTVKILDENVTNAKLAHSSVAVTDGATSHTLSLGGTLTFSDTSGETEVDLSGGTLTIGLADNLQLKNVTAGTLGVTNNLTVGGNLTVSGTMTTINTETIKLADNIIELNSNLASTITPSENAGIEINRGSLGKVALQWNENDESWQVSTQDGSTYYDIVNTGDTGTVSATMIAADAIDGSKIADNVIDSEHYATGSIDNEHIADNTITSSKLADFSTSLAATLSKSSGNLIAGNGSTFIPVTPQGDISVQVSGGTIAFGIAAGAIVDADISGTAAIAGSKLANNSVTTAQLANTGSDRIQTANIADGAVQTAKIANQAVTKAKLHTDVAGDGLTGGNDTALALDLSSVTAASLDVASDSIAFLDVTTSGSITTYATRTESIADLVNAFSGEHMSADAGVLSIDNFANVTAGSVTGDRAVVVDTSRNVSGFGTVTATAFSGTLSGQVGTAVQSSITSIPNLGTVGALGSGSITSSFGSIDIGASSISAGTITADNGFVGNVTGNVSGNLTGTVLTPSQGSITTMSNLTTVGTLSAGAINTGFGSINVGQSAISGGTITGTHITDGTATLQNGTLTADKVILGNLEISDNLIESVTGGTLNIFGTGDPVKIEGVTFNGSAVTGISNLTAGNVVTAATFAGNLSGVNAALTGSATANTLSDGVATLASGTISGLRRAAIDDITINDQSITQGGANKDLTISASGSVIVDGVTFNGSTVTGITSLTATTAVTAPTLAGTLSTSAQPNITSLGTLSSLDVDKLNLDDYTLSSSTIMQISAGTGKAVTIESVSINGGTVTGVSTLSTSGDATVGGDLAVSGGNITGNAGTLLVEDVTFNGSTVTGISDLTATGTVTAAALAGTLSTSAQPNITSLGTLSSLSVDKLSLNDYELSSSTIVSIQAAANKKVVIEEVEIEGGDISGVYNLTVSQDVTVSGDIYTDSVQATSSTSSVEIENVAFNGGTITGVTALTASGQVSGGSLTDGTATLSAGTLSGATKIVVDEITIDDTSITQAGANGTKNLTVSASNGNVLIEGVTFNGSTVTGIGNLTAANVITANTFEGAFNGEVSSDVLSASTLSVSSRFTLGANTEFYIDTTEVTATAAEINLLDGSVAGTAVASKALVLDGDKRVTGVEKVTLNNTNAGEDALTLTNGNITLATGNLVLTQGDLTVNSRLEVGPNSVVTSTANEMRFEDSLLELNYDSNASLSDATNLERHGGIWMQADKDNASSSTTGLLVDPTSDWYLIKGSSKPNTNYLSGLSSKTRADLYVGGISSSAGVQRAVETVTVSTNLTSDHHIVFSSSAITVTLPAAADHTGREYVVVNTDTGTNDISIKSNQNINGSANDVSVSATSSKTFVSDGTGWWTI